MYLIRRGAYTRVFRESKKGDKGGREDGKGARQGTGPEGERGGKNEGKREERGLEAPSKTLIFAPCDLGTL